MTGMRVFPTRLFGPSSLQVRVTGQSLSGGSNMVNEPQLIDIGGGGRVVADFGDVGMMADRAKLLAWDRFETSAQNGAAPILLPFANRFTQPVNPKYLGTDPFGRLTWIDDPTDWAAEEVTATTTADAAVNATSLTFDFTAPKPLLGGEWVSILHENYGWRAYKSWRVSAGGLGTGDSTTLLFNPPLREAALAGTPLNFESPRCVMSAPGDQSAVVSQLKFGKGQAHFVEYPGKIPT